MTRAWLQGEPTIVISQGQVLKKSLKALRLSTDELSMLLRREKIFDYSQVAYAILEPNGKLSILEKPEQQILTRNDLRRPVPALKYLPVSVINDGRLNKENIKELGLEEDWLYRQIREQGYNKMEDVFYAQVQSDGSLYIAPL